MKLRSPLRTCHEVSVEANYVMGDLAIQFHSVLPGTITTHNRTTRPEMIADDLFHRGAFESCHCGSNERSSWDGLIGPVHYWCTLASK